jgi:cell division protein FtsZ
METETSQAKRNEVAARKFVLKVVGLGGGGGNAVDYMAGTDFDSVHFTAVNTDAQALGLLKLPGRMTLGEKLTRGLGTGGDPARGRAAAEEDIGKLRELVTGADVVCVVVGLGGGTGTGAGPVVARLARESGALVLGIATLPFEFEGGRRARQAQQGLKELKAEVDGVICLPNQKVLQFIDDKTGVEEALRITNELLAQGVRGIWRLISQSGMINVDFNDVCSVLRGRHEESSLATVEVSGENRAQQLVDKLLAHPFLEGGQTLAESDTVLISITGGPDLAMSEVNKLMEQINRQCENAHIIMGAGIQEAFAGKLSVTLVASRGKHEQEGSRGGDGAEGDYSGVAAQREDEVCNPTPATRPESRYVAEPPQLTPQQTEQILNGQKSRSRKKGAGVQQMRLDLEIVTRGRFAKGEPTIHRGQDLDVPTYIRKGVALN